MAKKQQQSKEEVENQAMAEVIAVLEKHGCVLGVEFKKEVILNQSTLAYIITITKIK